MAEEDVTLNITTPGAPDAARALEDLTSKMVAATKASQDNHAVSQAMVKNLGEQKGAVAGLVDSLKGLKESFEKGESSGGTLNGTMGVLNAAFQAAVSPLGLVAVGLGAVVIGLDKLADSALQTFRAIRQLQAMSGQTAEKAEEMANAFKLAGAEDVSMALFRMGNQVEMGGKQLEKFGIAIRDNGGALKTEGDLLLEVRDYLGGIGDASQRNAALMQLFGRAGRSLAPAFAKSREEFEKYLEKAHENSAVNDEFMEQAKRYQETLTEMGMRWDKMKITLATTIALPVLQFFTDMTQGAIKAGKSIGEVLTKSLLALRGVLTGQVFTKAGREELMLAMFPPPEKVKEQAEKTAEAGSSRLVEAEAQHAIHRMKIANETQTKLLKGEEQYNAQRLKMETGSDVEAAESKMELNRRLIQMAKDQADAERAELLKVTPQLDTETELKIEKEKNDKIVGYEQENKMLTLKIKQDRVNDTKRTMDDELQVQKAHSQEMVATLEIQKSRELALNKEATQSTVQQSIEQNKIEERYATATANMRKEQIDNEIRAQKEFAEKFPDNFAVQEEVNKKVIELGVQRSNSEREVNQQILQSRVQLVDKLKQEADREAGLGDQLTNKAIENLKKRGRTRASIGEITEEIGRIRGRQQEALAQGMYGGQMNLAEYQAAIGDRGLWGGLTKMGTTEAGAIGQSFAQTAGAAFGQMPGTYLPSNVSMGPGGAPQFNAPNVDPIIDSYTSAFAKIPDAVDKSIERIGERIDRGWRTVEEKLSDRIEENLTRRLEFESARQ